MVSKSNVAVSTTGYLDRDSSIASTMQIEFSGIRLAGTDAGSGFAITFTAFYNGYFLTYVTPPFSVMPNTIALEAPWGTWGDFAEFDDAGPWQVHEELPAFTVALTVLNTTATSIVAADNFYVGARLFDKNSLADISAASLTGTTRILVQNGKATFEGLSVGLVAGTGFRMSFFVEGSDEPCLPSILRVVCDQFEEKRGLAGGLGGYEIETMSDDISIYPDLLSLDIHGRHPPILRVDETMFTYSIKFFDSANPSVAIANFAPSDGFSVSVSLRNGEGSDVSSWGLDGTKSVSPSGETAVFDDLVVKGTAGANFRLRFRTSWNGRCVAKLVDTTCAGKCCIQTDAFFVYPYAIKTNPSTLSGITEGSTLSSITVQFEDFSGATLSGITTADGFTVTPFLRKRGTILSIEGETTLAINAGVAVFSGLTIREDAGSQFTLLFQEDNSQISAVTAPFPVYGQTLQLDSAAQNAIQAGESLLDVSVRVLGSTSQTLTSIEASDSFTVTVYALKKSSGGSFADCGCIAGTASRDVDSGVVVLSGLTIRSTIGRFKLQAQQLRTSLTALTVDTDEFSVLPASLVFTASGFRTAYETGETLPDITIQFADINNNIIGDVGGETITMRLLYVGNVVSASAIVQSGGSPVQFLPVTVSSVTDAATFSDLEIDGRAGSNYQLEFTFQDPDELTTYTVTSPEFDLRPSQLSVNNTQPDTITAELLPPMAVSLADGAGGTLFEIAASDAFVVSASLDAGTLLGCIPRASSPTLSTPPTQVDAELNATECGTAAGKKSKRVFMTDLRNETTAAYEALLAELNTSHTDTNNNQYRVTDVVDACGVVEVFTNGASSWSPICGATFTAATSAALCLELGLGESEYAGTTRPYGGSNGKSLVCGANASGTGLCSLSGAGACGGSVRAEVCCAGLRPQYKPICDYELVSAGLDPEENCIGGDPCWVTELVPGAVCGSGGVCCGPECQCGADQLPVHGIVNRTQNLLGTKSVLVSQGQALFLDLRVTGLFGTGAFWLRFSDNGGALGRTTTTKAFSVGPPRIIVKGITFSARRVSEPLSGVNVTLTDLNGRALTPMPQLSGPPFASDPYRVQVTATHTPSAVFSETVGVLGGAVRNVIGSSVNFTGITVDGQAGSGFRYTFTLNRAVGPVSATSRNFTLFPDQFAFPSGPIVLSNLSDQAMPAVTLECQTSSKVLLSNIRADDGLVVQVQVLDRNGTLLPACTSPVDTGCLSGTTQETVVSGLVTFGNVIIQGTAGTGFVYRWTMLGGGPSLLSPLFSVYPGQIVIAEGIADFFGQYWVVNRGVGDYAIRLQSPTTGVHSAGVVASDGFNISAELRDTTTGADLTGTALQGQKWYIASYDGGAHAVFTDLVITTAGAGFQLSFKFNDALSALEASTSTFRVVPYSLRISQRCYNGNALNISGSVPFGVPQLACVGADNDAPSDFGIYGFLTGYYYYVDNSFIGPLLKTVRGFARIPTIEVTATDLFGTQLSGLELADGMVIQVDLYSNAVAFSDVLGGTTQQTLEGGAAVFDDLTVGNVTGCVPTCDILLRFSLVGALCQDTWCANVTMSLEETQVTPPHELGSHPAFPGTQSISGVAVIPLLNALTTDEEDLFKSAIVAFSGVSLLSPSDVTIVGVDNATSSRRLLATTDLEVSFRVAARTFAQASAIYARVTAFLDSGAAVFSQVCNPAQQATLDLCDRSVTLKEPLSRQVISLLLNSRVPTPTFSPTGSSSACARTSSCTPADFSTAFQDFSVTIETVAASTVYYTMDTCPTPLDTEACTSTGSVLSTSSLNVSSGTPIAVITSSPVSTILPVNLTRENPLSAGDASKLAGASGWRYVAEMPRAVTVKAYGVKSGLKAGFQGAATYGLPTQASAPTFALKQKWVLGWCDGTNYEDCKNLHDSFNGSECNSAVAVPCTSFSNGLVCSAGSNGSTVERDGVYDGALVGGGATTLTEDYGAGQSAVFVSSLAALGFSNDGSLPAPRTLRVGVNGELGSAYSALTVTAVDQATSSLTVDIDLNSGFAEAGKVVELLQACVVSRSVLSTATVGLASSTPGVDRVDLYYTIDGSTPSSSSRVLGASGQLAFRLPASLRVVAAADGVITSFPLEVDLVKPCGDGESEGGEQCDDGNLVDGDGCSAECQDEGP